MKIFFNKTKMLLLILIVSGSMTPHSAGGQSSLDGTSLAKGFVIIINDLVKVDEKGLLATHETERDAELNIQAQVSGNIRIGKDGFWYFKQGQTVKFQKPVMYLTFEKTEPLSIEVLFNLLNEKEETQDLPVLIKAKNDNTGRRFKVRINGGMMAGVLLRPDD